MERTQARFERFAQLRAAYPEMEYENIMAWIHEEEVNADDFAHYRMLDSIDRERQESYADAA